MYQIGDLIVYGKMGICKIVDIKTLNLQHIDKTQLYYVLKPLYQECTVSSPVNNQKVFMRPVISKEEAERLIEMIPTIQAEAYLCGGMRQLSEHYAGILNTHDCTSLIELTMSIYAKKQYIEEQKRKFGMVDERFMKLGEELLFGELAVALDIPREEVAKYISAKIKKVHEDQKNQEDKEC